MPVYTYKAVDLDATAVAGEVAADTPRQARDLLRGRGLTVEQIRPRPPREAASVWARRRARRHAGRTTGFIRDLAALAGAGIPLTDSLQTLSRQYSGPFGAVVLSVGERVASGASLAEAMEAQGPWFDRLCVSIVRVGERTGTLDEALSKLADFREHAEGLRSRIGTVLLYPAIVTVIGTGVTVFLMTFVVPRLLSALRDSGRELPAITRAVQAVSDFLLGYGWLVGLAVVAAVIGLRLIVRTGPGRRAWHRLLMRAPLVGELIVKETLGRLAVVLAALLRSGVVFVEALEVAEETTANVVFRAALARCREAVAAGKDLAEPLERAGVFPPMVVRMLAVGQQAGELEGMLEKLAASYERQVAVATARLAAVLEPLLIVVLALMVGVIALATILPILEASNVL